LVISSINRSTVHVSVASFKPTAGVQPRVECTLQKLASVQETEVHVSLPEFRLQTEFSLDQTLSPMGMGDAFDAAADFSGIDGTKILYISSVRHRAFVEVNEEGTKAAATTATHYAMKVMPARFMQITHSYF
jgi:serine protease inhibitor